MTNAELEARRALAQHPLVAPPETLTVEAVDDHTRVHGEGVELNVWPNGGLVGTAKVDPFAARLRLLAYLVFALTSAWRAAPLFLLGLVLVALPLRFAESLRLLNPAVTAAVTIGFSAWLAVRFSEWVATLKPALFDEPVGTVAEGVVRWPAPAGLEELLRRSRLLLIPSAVMMALMLLSDALQGARLGAASKVIGLGLLSVIWVKTRAWAAPAKGVTTQTVKAGGDWGELTSTALEGVRFTLIVVLCGLGARLSGALDTLATATHVPQLTVSNLFSLALRGAVILAVVRARPSNARTLTLVALIAGTVGEAAWGDAGQLLFALIGIFATFSTALRHAPREAVRLTARFELSLALGRIAGTVLAALFLGGLGLELGKTLGEQLAALLSAARLEPVTVDATRTSPMSNTTLRWAVGIALVLAGLLSLRPPASLDSWQRLEGNRWSVRWPSKPEWKRVDGGRYAEARWHDTRFYVREATAPDDPSDADAFMATAHLLDGQPNGCGGVTSGLWGNEFMRCVGRRFDGENRFAIACAFTDVMKDGYADGEREFLASFGESVGRVAPGLSDADCNIPRSQLRELRHRAQEFDRLHR